MLVDADRQQTDSGPVVLHDDGHRGGDHVGRIAGNDQVDLVHGGECRAVGYDDAPVEPSSGVAPVDGEIGSGLCDQHEDGYRAIGGHLLNVENLNELRTRLVVDPCEAKEEARAGLDDARVFERRARAVERPTGRFRLAER